jgi:hypothetical protein
MRTASRTLAVAGAATLALVTGVALGTGLASSPAHEPIPAAQAVPMTQAAPLTEVAPALAGTTGQAATDAELALLAPELGNQAAAAPGARLRQLARVGGKNLVHAEVVVDRSGTLVTFQVDRGSVSAVGSGLLTIAEAGARSETVTTTGATRVRKDGKKASVAALAKGDQVVVVSRVENGKATAAFILVPKPKDAAPSKGTNPATTPVPKPQG